MRGAAVEVIPIYRTVKSSPGLEKLRSILTSEKVDCLVCTSPSSIHSLAESLGNEMKLLLKGVVIAVIGPIAMESAEKVGLRPAIQPQTSTAPELVRAIREYFKKNV